MPPQPLVEIRSQDSHPGWTYVDLDLRQKEVAAKVEAGKPGALLISEVLPVITLGRRTPPSDLLLPRSEYARLGVPILPVERGGLATYHGPGQWVVFAVDSLERLTGDRRGVRKAVTGLLNAAFRVACAHLSSVEIRCEPQTGVWVRSGGKIASVGVQVSRGVLLHGLAVNAVRAPGSFVGLRPCGLDAEPAFLLKDRDGFQEVGERLRESCLSEFWGKATSL